MKLLERQVAVHDKVEKCVFESPLLDERPVIASYSARNATLAVGTDEGRVIIWDTHTSTQLADFEQGALDCRGLRLAGAKGLDQRAPNARISLGELLAIRGAMLTPAQLLKLRHMSDFPTAFAP